MYSFKNLWLTYAYLMISKNPWIVFVSLFCFISAIHLIHLIVIQPTSSCMLCSMSWPSASLFCTLCDRVNNEPDNKCTSSLNSCLTTEVSNEVSYVYMCDILKRPDLIYLGNNAFLLVNFDVNCVMDINLWN